MLLNGLAVGSWTLGNPESRTGGSQIFITLPGRKDFALGSEESVLKMDDDEIKGDVDKTTLTLEGQGMSTGIY